MDAFTRVYSQVHGVPIVVINSLDAEAIAIRAVQTDARDHQIKGRLDRDQMVRICYE